MLLRTWPLLVFPLLQLQLQLQLLLLRLRLRLLQLRRSFGFNLIPQTLRLRLLPSLLYQPLGHYQNPKNR